MFIKLGAPSFLKLLLLLDFRTLHCASYAAGHCRLQAPSWGFSSPLCALFLGSSHSPMALKTIYILYAYGFQIYIFSSQIPELIHCLFDISIEPQIQHEQKRTLDLFFKLQTVSLLVFPIQ